MQQAWKCLVSPMQGAEDVQGTAAHCNMHCNASFQAYIRLSVAHPQLIPYDSRLGTDSCHVLSRNHCIEDKIRKVQMHFDKHCSAPLQCASCQAVMAGVHEIWGTPGASLGLLFLIPAKDLSHVVRFWPRRCFSCKQTVVSQVLWRVQQLPL